MAGLFGNLKSSLTQSIAEVSTQTSAQNQRQTDMSKIETKVKEIDIKLGQQYLLLGQAIADNLRQGEEVHQESIYPLFFPIKDLDVERAKLMSEIAAIKSQQADQQKAQDLIQTKKEVAAEIEKLKELQGLGVIGEEEFELTEAKLKKRVDNFDKLYNLKIAFERGLITKEVFAERKAAM
jgi:hypothetical protein